MDRQHVAKTWVFRGLCDLFFAFDNDDASFEDNAVFSEIMGLEKFLKAMLLYHRHQEYEGLSEPDARTKLNAVAMKLGHEFKGMMKEVADLGVADIERIMHRF